MEQSGEYRVTASREKVFAALNDPDVLARCLDGCESMERVADDRFDARIKAKVGPVRATFDAELTLEDVEPPERYTINANVKGGAAGFARGYARVNLTDEGEQTLLAYNVDASIGGKLAQVGSRLIDGAARKMADDFFARFSEEVGGTGAQGDAAGAPVNDQGAPVHDVGAPSRARTESPLSPSSATQPARYQPGGKWVIWTAVFVALLLALMFAF